MSGAWISPTSQAAAHALLAALNLDPRPPPVLHSLFRASDLAVLNEDNLFGYIVVVGWPSSPSSSASSPSNSGTHTPTSSHTSSSHPASISAADLFKDRANEKLDALPKATYIIDRMLYSSTASLTIVPESALLKPCARRGETLRAFPREFKKVFSSFECVDIRVKQRVGQGKGAEREYEYEFLIEGRGGTEGEGKQEWAGAREMKILMGMG